MSEIPLRPWEQHDYQVWRPDGTFIICPDAATAALVVRLVNSSERVVKALEMARDSLDERYLIPAKSVPAQGRLGATVNALDTALALLRGDRPADGGER